MTVFGFFFNVKCSVFYHSEGAGGISRKECGGNAAPQRGQTLRLCGPKW